MIRKLMALSLTALALAACGGDEDSSTGPAPVPQNGTITMLNDSNTPIVSVNISRCTDASWGSNRLNPSETVQPGATRSWTVPVGCYDFRASTGERSASWFDLNVTVNQPVQLGVPSSVDPENSVGQADLADAVAFRKVRR
jgi:hypothetical protein